MPSWATHYAGRVCPISAAVCSRPVRGGARGSAATRCRQVAGAAHELRYRADVIADADEPDTGRAAELLAEAQRFAQNLPPEWPEVGLVRSGLDAVDLLRRGPPYTPDEVRSLGWGIGKEDAAINERMVRDHLRTVAERLESYASIHNNAAIRRGLWELEGEHLF